ncbi:MAG: hypothetical protein M0Q92_10025 [Methanoregula sp.]|nr:hypothetical protein [Methanoregula sp.]
MDPKKDPVLKAIRIKKISISMTTQFHKPEITGTRTGYVIRFTCPLCATENIIINKTPRDHFKEARDASCKDCRKRFSIRTPNGPPKKSSPIPETPVIARPTTP